MTSRRQFLGAAAVLAALPDPVAGDADKADVADYPKKPPTKVFARDTWGSIHVNDLGGDENCSVNVTDFTHNDSPILAEVYLTTPLGKATFALEQDEAEEMHDALGAVIENHAGGDR